MPLRIGNLETRIVEHPLRTGRMIVSAGGVHSISRFVQVCATNADGVRGYGEAATTPQWSGETAASAEALIRTCFSPRLIGASFDHPSDALAAMESAAWGNPFAKGAVDAALWDLWGRQEKKRVAAMVGDREPLTEIPTRGAVGAYPIEKSVEIAAAFTDLGCRTLKFKIGVPGIDDVARVRAARDRVGNEVVFTVDANAGYRTADAAVRAIEALLPYRIALFEQPTPRGRFGMMREVRKRIPIPVMADEGVFTPDELAEAIDHDCFDVLSVYTGKNGGFTRSLEMALTAQKGGKVCSIGSNRETDLGNAANLNLAAALTAFPVERIACDVVASYYYEQSSITRPLDASGGRVKVPEGPGFGVEPLPTHAHH
jgi:muconate cycloisomerase